MLKDITILIVDDSAHQRKKLTEMYRQMEFVVVDEAKDGLEGFKMWEKHRPQIVSLDVILPVMHGIEVLRKIKEHDRDAIVVLLSAMAPEEILPEFQNGKISQPDAILCKQDSRETIFNTLNLIIIEREQRLLEEEAHLQQQQPLQKAS